MGAVHFRRGPWQFLSAVALGAVLVACGGDDEVATEREAIPQVTPTAVAVFPEGVQEAAVAVDGGAFAVDDLILRENEPTVLHVANADDRAYRLTIGDLVVATPVAAGGTTDVGFTTPNPGVFEGHLLPADGETPLDTLRVVVQAAGGVEP